MNNEQYPIEPHEHEPSLDDLVDDMDYASGGEVPSDDTQVFQSSILEKYHARLDKIKDVFKPDEYEIITILKEIDKEEIPTNNLHISLGQKGHEYAVRIVHGVGEHKKEIAATITVAGLLFAITKIRSRRKDEK